MAMLPDLVRDSKLSTHFLGAETIHTYQKSDPTSGKRLISRTEHWRRHEKIGSGAYGSVWLEKCTKGHRDGARVRAVKQSHLDSRSGPVDYTRELEVIAKFSSSNYARCFVKSFGWYENSGNICIAMEYLEKGDLRDYLDHSRSPLSEDETREITFQILEGLDMMHQNSFAHRDLKPHNILIQSHPPSTWWVKLADFGISKRIEEASGGSTLHGTPGYIAPELWKLTGRGSPYAPDIWALGETIFQLLTKEPAFPNIALLVSYVSDPDTFPVKAFKKSGTSQLGIEFVRGLLHPLPSSRPTAPEAISHKWVKRKVSETPDPQSSQNNHAGLVNYPRSFASMTEEFASLNTRISIPEGVNPSAKARPLMGTLIERDAESNGAECNDAEPNDAESDGDESNETTKFKLALRERSHGSSSSFGKLYRRDKLQTGDEEWASYIDFSPDGETLVVGSGNTIRLWTVGSPTKRIGRSIQGKAVHKFAFSPDGKYLASGSEGGASSGYLLDISLWDLSSLPRIALFKRIKAFTGFGSRSKMRTKHLCFSPNGKLLASGDSMGTVQLWKVDDPEFPQYIGYRRNLLLGVTFLPDGKLLFVDSSGINIWDDTVDFPRRTKFPHTIRAGKVIFSSDRKYFIYHVSATQKIEFRFTATGKLFRSINCNFHDQILSMDLSPNGHIIAATVYNGKHKGSQMITLDTTDGTELQVVTNAHKREATALAFSPNSQLLATGCHGGVIRTWANKKETEIRSGRRIDMGEETLSRRAKIMTLSVE